MRRLFVQFFALVVAGFMLVSCASKKPHAPQPVVCEIAGASVTGGKGVSARLTDELQRRIDASIAITSRGVPMRRVYLEIGIMAATLDGGLNEIENRAQIQVVARDATSGEPVYLNDFASLVYSNENITGAAALAESIAARIRFEFVLAVPSPQAVAEYRPISTRLDEQLIAPQAAPRANGDALLNANTRFDTSGEIEVKSSPGAFPEAPASAATLTPEAIDLPKPVVEAGVTAPTLDNDGADEDICVVTIENDCTVD